MNITTRIAHNNPTTAPPITAEIDVKWLNGKKIRKHGISIFIKQSHVLLPASIPG